MALTTTTTHAALIPEIWEKKIFMALYGANYMRNDLNGFSVPHGADTFKYPHIPVLTGEDIVEGTPGTIENVTPTTVSLNIDQYIGVRWAITRLLIMQVQAGYDVQSGYAVSAAAALEKIMETRLLSLYAGMSQELVYSALTLDAILEGHEKLDDADVPDTGRFLYVDPYNYRLLCKIAGIDDVSKTDDKGFQNTRRLAEIFGCVVRKSTGIAANSGHRMCMLFHSDFADVGVQQELTVDVEAGFNTDIMGHKSVASMLFGYQEQRDDHAVKLAIQLP